MADWERERREREGLGRPAPPEGRPDAGPMSTQTSHTYQPGGGAARGYGEGGDTPYGQMASGSSVSGLGGYSGADVGGWGQPVQNSQWGQGGYGPLNQGIDYGQDGGRFGPRGYDTGNFGPTPTAHRDEHHGHYQRWRDTQLQSHDRDYARWRDQQSRRYDEEYGAWRNERHDAFSREFEGWRAGRGGQAGVGEAVHGANPTLANIADGKAGHRHHHAETKPNDPDDVSRS